MYSELYTMTTPLITVNWLRKPIHVTLKTKWKRKLVYKAINDLTPSYISDMFEEKTVNYNVRASKPSTHKLMLTIHEEIREHVYGQLCLIVVLGCKRNKHF